MNQRKLLSIAASTALSLGLFAHAAQAAQGYTVRIAMGNETYAPFTLEKVSKSETNLNEKKSTPLETEVGYAESGSYNFLHNTKRCEGNYKFKVVGKAGIVLGECKVSYGAVHTESGCGLRTWNDAKCENTGTTNIQFNTSSKGAHHHDFTIK